MKKYRLLTGFIILVLLAAQTWGCVTAGPTTGESAKEVARRAVWTAITSGKAGSATVAIMDGGVTVYAEGFGMADRAMSVPVDRSTVFNIASVSKVYCATAVMALVDDGKVRLDSPVTDYLPEFTMADPRYKDITVRMLLNHTSGLPGSTFPNGFGSEYNKDYDKAMMEIFRQAHLTHRPGESAPYCNDGFSVAEVLVARVSGMPYIDFLKQRVLGPLNLTLTGPSVGQRQGDPGVVIANDYTTAGKRKPAEALSVLGSGGLSATAEDMCRFAELFSGAGPQILSQGSLAEMKKEQPSALKDQVRTRYGLGWDFVDLPMFKEQGIDILGKTGGSSSYSSMLFTVPNKRISVAVVVTGSHGAAPEIALEVLEAYLADKGLYTKKAKEVKAPAEGEEIPQAVLDCSGYYSAGSSLLKLTVDAKTKVIGVSMFSEGKESLIAAGLYHDGYFEVSGAKYVFRLVGDRLYYVKQMDDYGVDDLVCQKLMPVASPQKLKAEMADKQWLRRNAKAFEGADFSQSYVCTSRVYSELPGYVDFYGPKRIDSPTTAMPVIAGIRDLAELALFDKDGQTWVWLTGLLYMPAEAAKAFSGGTAEVTIGQEGYNEWLRLTKGAVLEFEAPAKGRVIVFDAGGKSIYDSTVDNGPVYAPAGGFVDVAAEPGQVFRVKGR